jgi:hypothetical protein
MSSVLTIHQRVQPEGKHKNVRNEETLLSDWTPLSTWKSSDWRESVLMNVGSMGKSTDKMCTSLMVSGFVLQSHLSHSLLPVVPSPVHLSAKCF